MLSSLPESLDETYERMLCNINSFLIEDARQILTLLCYAPRPLLVQELIDAVAVEIKNPTGLNRRRRLQDINGIRDICGGLIDMGLSADHMTENDNEEELTRTVRIAHFSVQEYLESERIRHQKAAMFSLTSATAHAQIAQVCLIYLLDDSLSRSELDQSILEEYPLAEFAAEYWYYHYQNTARSTPIPHDCVLRLFQSQNSFAFWVALYNPDDVFHRIRFDRSLDGIPTPIYYASLLGLDQALHKLLTTEQVESTQTPGLLQTSTSKLSKLVNAQAGNYGNPLQAASYKGHGQIVQILLNKGADVNAQAGYYGNPLQAASYGGHDQVVQILLDKGADVNAQARYCDNALLVASIGGYYQVMKILLDEEADVKAHVRLHGKALQAASSKGFERLVKMLLDKGADVNAQGVVYRTALHEASIQGHDQVVKMLLDKGADINAQDEFRRTALHAASYRGHDHVVQILLDEGADINTQGEFHGNALHAASGQGHDQVVRMLLDKGADINAEDTFHHTALSSALHKHHDKVVEVLLDKGAELKDEDLYNLLNSALHGDHDKIARLKDAHLYTLLNVALHEGLDKTLQMLLGKVVNTEAFDGLWREAFSSGNDRMLRLLRDHDPVFDRRIGH